VLIFLGSDSMGRRLGPFPPVHDDPTIVSADFGGASPRGELAPGAAFGDYVVVRLLGRGGMSEVYEAEHLHLGRRCALKVLPAGLTGDPGFRARFRREARVLASLEHPHIVRVQHAAEFGGRFFIAMELLPGSLARFVPGAGGGAAPEQPLPPRFVATVAGHVLQALVFAHGLGVVHRDLKPANVLLDAQGAAKLADFGVAQAVGGGFVRTLLQRTVAQALAAEAATRRPQAGPIPSGAVESSLAGTLDYMAPEVRAGLPADGRADLFALGVITYELLTGRKPLGRYREASILAPGIDGGWDRFIDRALEPEPGDRWPDAAAMAAALPAVDAPAGPPPETAPASEPAVPSAPADAIVRRAPSGGGRVSEPLAEPARTKSQRPRPRLDAVRPREQRPWTVPELGLAMAWVPPGQFLMGSPAGERGRGEDEGPRTRVTLTRGFWLGIHEVTQGEWRALMRNNPSRFRDAGARAPVEQVSWNEAAEFCARLDQRERAAHRLPDGCAYVLPTEAQWEYACRAGTSGLYAGEIDALGWHEANSGGAPRPVGQKKANAWGLFDMHGNVWEWCRDRYIGKLPGGAVADPGGPPGGPAHAARVRRGGGWFNFALCCRSAIRCGNAPDYRSCMAGFRVALASDPARSGV
jgi:formylglycine-generating enzyme required for sulfatase activity